MDLNKLSNAELLRELEVLREAKIAGDERDRLIHELEVHQVELELQNRELREAHATVEESRGRYADLYDFAPVAYLTLDTKGVVQEINLTGATMLGKDRAHVVGLGFLSVARVRDSAGFWAHLRRGAESREPVVSELQVHSERHGLIDLQIASTPVFDPSGRVIALRTSFTDITPRKQAERELERLRVEEGRLRARFEMLDQVSLALSGVLAQLRTSKPEQLLDVIAEESRRILDAEFAAVGIGADPTRPFSSWATSGVDPALVATIGRVPRPVGLLGEIQRTGRAIRLRDLRTHPAFRGFPEHHPVMRSFLGTPIEVRGKHVGSLYVTNKRGAEEFSEEDQRLAEMLAVRVGVLMEVERLHSEVEAAVRARNDLLAVVSHDLRSPLSAIKLGAVVVARTLPDELQPARRAIDGIIRSADRMSHLIDDLQQAAAIESGTFAIEPSVQHAQDLLDELVQATEQVAAARSIRIETSVAAKIPPIWCDRSRILQVLTNLVGNSIKFASEGSAIEIRVSEDTGHVTFAVSDRGPGISENQLPHLFDRYWKGTPGGPQGVGLGLYISKGIVETHGGRIWVESRVGEGTTFSFSLPIAR